MPERDVNAVLLALYLWMFVILRVAWVFVPEYSTMVLAVLAFLITTASVLLTPRWLNQSSSRALAMIAIVVLMILVDLLLRPNTVQPQRLYEFVIYAAIPVLLLSQVRDLALFFRAYVVLAVITFALYVSDPFLGYPFSQSYMVFGFQAMLPAAFGLHIGRRWFRWTLLAPLELVALVALLVFGNRMAGVAALAFVALYELAFRRPSATRPVVLAILAAMGAAVMVNLEALVETANQFLSNHGYSSYALNSVLLYLSGTVDSLSAERTILWRNGMDLIAQSPIIGHGVGYFESVYGIYPHNFVVEILCSGGLVVLAAVAVALSASVSRLVRGVGLVRLLGLLLLCASIPRLLTSVYVFVEPAFWMLLYFGAFMPSCRFQEFAGLGLQGRAA